MANTDANAVEQVWLKAFDPSARADISEACNRLLHPDCLATLACLDLDQVMRRATTYRMSGQDVQLVASDTVALFAVLLLGRIVCFNYFIDELYNHNHETARKLNSYEYHLLAVGKLVCTGTVGFSLQLATRTPPRVGVFCSGKYYSVPLIHRQTGQPVVDPRAIGLLGVLVDLSAGLEQREAWCTHAETVLTPGPLQTSSSLFALGERAAGLISGVVCRVQAFARLALVTLGFARSFQPTLPVCAVSTRQRMFLHVYETATLILDRHSGNLADRVILALRTWADLALRAIRLDSDRVEDHAALWRDIMALAL